MFVFLMGGITMSIAMTTKNITMDTLKHNSQIAMIAIQNNTGNRQTSKSRAVYNASERKNIIRNKKRQVLKRKFDGIIFSVLLICLLSIILGNVSSKAMQEKTKPDVIKYFTSIQIKDGESLWQIASNNLNTEYYDLDAYMDEIASINNISEDETLLSGEFIIIPYFASANDVSVASTNP